MSDVYPVGTLHKIMPIPPIDEHCVSLAAGPLRLVVESRQLTDELARAASPEIASVIDGRTGPVDDHGASLHVFGAVDGLEHVRFDCFENEPHYHYIRNADQAQVICRLDDVAEGDPIAWTISRLRQRLPQMLDFAGVPALANEVRADFDEVLSKVDEVAELLHRADKAASQDRVSA